MLPFILSKILILFIYYYRIHSSINATIKQLLVNQVFTDAELNNIFIFYPHISINPPSSNISICYLYSLLGGINVIGINKYTVIKQQIWNIQPHYSLTLSFLLYKFNNWNGALTVNVSSISMLSKNYLSYAGRNDPKAYTSRCLNQNYYTFTLFFTINDNFDSNLTISYNAGSSNSVFGIRNMIISILLCHPSCMSCYGPLLTDCTKCIENAILPNCDCNPGYYLNVCGQSATNPCINICKSCYYTCATCYNGSNSGCKTCISGYNLQGSVCQSGCLINQYMSLTSICIACSLNCSSCLNITFCTSCNDSTKYLYLGQCISICPQGTYPDNITKTCEFCESDCLICNAGLASDCLLCVDQTKYLYNGSCLENCPLNTYISSMTCYVCNPICNTCQGPDKTDCLSCSLDNFYEGTCINDCPNGTYAESNTCLSCDSNCLTCYGQSFDNCLSCESDKIPINNVCFCVNGTYLNTFNQCSICDPSCLTCNESTANNCLTCNLTDGRFFYSNSSQCLQCDPLCSTCSGPSSDNCLTCTTEKSLVNNSCYCQNGSYFDKMSKLCIQCDSSCLECSGSSSSDCMSCINSSKSIIMGKCVDVCPQGYYSDSLKSCKNCKINCKICQNYEICQSCFDGYVLGIDNNCITKKNVQVQIETIKNPTTFKLIFSDYWQFLMDNLSNSMVISISNYSIDNYTYTFVNTNNTCLISMNYKNSLDRSSGLKLKILISINNSNSYSEYYMENQNFLIPLQSYINCPINYYYNSVYKSCQSKYILKPTLILTDNHLQISLLFSYSFDYFQEYVQNYSKVTISSLSSPKDYQITYQQNGNNVSYLININSSTGIINRPKLTYCLNLLQETITKENLLLTNCQSLSLLDWYPLSESAQNSIDNAKKQTQINNVMSSNGMSTILASASGIFLFGLMMIEMIYFLKYVNVNYPINALSLFESKQSNFILFFHYSFSVNEQDSDVLPQLFTYYGISPYFLNNIGDILCQILAIFFVSFFLILLNSLVSGRLCFISKVLSSIESIMIWELVIIFIFLSMQKLFFYITCALCFFPIESSQGILNSLLSLIIAIILILWISILFIHTKKCQDFRLNQEVLSPSLGKSEIFQKSSISMKTMNNFVDKDTTSGAISFREDHKLIDKKTILVNDINTLNNNNEKINKILPLNQKDQLYINDYELEKARIENQMIFQETAQNPKMFKKEGNKSYMIAEKIRKFSRIFSTIGNTINHVVIQKNIKEIRCLKRIFEVKDWNKYVSKYETLYEDLKFKTIWHKYFKLFYYIRQILISIMVPCLYNYPLPQMILINILYLTFILYMLFNNPFESKIIFIINMVSEFICFSALFSVLIIAFLDYQNNDDYELKMNLGWVILFANVVLLYWVMVTGVIKIIYHLIYKYKQYKLKRKSVHPE